MFLYTIDGNDPTMASTLWNNKFLYLKAPAILKVKTFKNNWIPGITVTEKFDFDTLPRPVANYPDGTIFDDSLPIILKIPDMPDKTGIMLFYTLDGSDPQKFGIRYTGRFIVNNSCIMQAFSRKEGYYDSKLSFYEYFSMIKVEKAFYKNSFSDSIIDRVIVYFDKPLQMLPSLIEFTDPYSAENIIRVESFAIKYYKSANSIEVILDNPFIRKGRFLPGHYGRIPLPGEFDTEPFLISDSTREVKQ